MPDSDQLERDIEYSKTLKPGGHHYRAYVGPPDQYDFMGASQFRLLTALGLREEHRVVDIGCGSLRLGRLLLQYLLPERYFGIDPNEWLWKNAVQDEIGSDVISIKRPTFIASSDFTLTGIETGSVDFAIAQSIYSHTGIDCFQKSMAEVARVLSPNGQFVFTVLSEGVPLFGKLADGGTLSGWIYPKCVTYSETLTKSIVSDAGLHPQILPWHHPRQRWYRASPNHASVMSDEMLTAIGTGKPLFDSRFD